MCARKGHIIIIILYNICAFFFSSGNFNSGVLLYNTTTEVALFLFISFVSFSFHSSACQGDKSAGVVGGGSDRQPRTLSGDVSCHIYYYMDGRDRVERSRTLESRGTLDGGKHRVHCNIIPIILLLCVVCILQRRIIYKYYSI